MKVLSKQQVIQIHAQLIEETGGLGGLRDDGLLDSALAAPFQGYADVDAYPTLHQKAARLCYGLVMNHPFTDGNKRVGAHVMMVFLMLNGIELTYEQSELIEVILALATGTANYEDILEWILTHQS